jgi:hypothetical protein
LIEGVDEQQQSEPVRRRRSRTEAADLVAEYETSGLSRIEFCRNHRLSLSTFQRYWKRRRAQAEAEGVNLLRVELCGERPVVSKAEGSGLAVALTGGRRIEVARGFDAATLLQLVGLLERC